MSQTSIMVYSQMGLLKLPLVVLLCSVFSLLSFIALCDTSELTVKFLETPHAFSNLSSTKFVFEVLVGGSGACNNCNITCKLVDGFGRSNAPQCENGTVLCEGLHDGNHKFEVCPNGTQGVGCSSYNWTIDTVPPTANITASSDFTNALNVSINISFSEPCTGGRGFVCSSVNACNLLVYGVGQVIPTSLKMLQPNLQYSVLVGLSSTTQSGRVILVMDKNFCTDRAGNKFERNKNSNFILHFDRRSVNLTTHVPRRQLQFNGETILVRATNNYKKLRVCLTFPEPVLNTSEEIKNSLKAEILYSLRMSQGSLLHLVDTKKYEGPSRFEFKVDPNINDTIVVNVSVDTNSIISRHGTPISPVEPFAFIYDSLRPAVMLNTLPSESSRPVVMISTLPSEFSRPAVNTPSRTRERIIFVLIEFVKPVFGFSHSNISITGGKLQRFIKERNHHKYIVEIKADQDIVSVNVPENVTGDAAGNKNQPSNVLQVMHHSVPKISRAFYGSTSGSFVVTVTATGMLTVSIASLNSIGEFSSSFPSLSQSESNLFRIACHLQVIALSGWLAVRLPVEYYELTRGLRWSIPYLSLPWERETGHTRLVMGNSSLPVNIHSSNPQKSEIMKILFALVGKDYEPPAEEEDSESACDNGWSDFGRNMFWLAIFGGGFISVHALLLLIRKLKQKNSEKRRDYGILTFPRLEIVIVNLALPNICQASAAIIRGGTALGIAVGVLLLGVVSFLLLAWLLFLYKGITCAQLLEYEEVHQEGQGLHWYQKIVRPFLVLVEEHNWTKKKPYLTILGSLYEEFRGPPKSKPSQISGGSFHTQGADDKTEDAEAPFIQKLVGELRIYYLLLDSVKRVLLAIVGSVYACNSSSKIPTIISLCISCFQLFFLVLEKPHREINVQLVEIISISSETCIFAISFISENLPEKEDKTKFGVLMLILFLVGLLPQIMNELYHLYEQIKQLDSQNHFLTNFAFRLKGVFIKQPPGLKDNIADEDTATSTSTSYQVKSPNQD